MTESKIYEVYSDQGDMTFIMEETKTSDEKGKTSVTVEVKGFYYGEPDKESTKAFYGCNKAAFEFEED